MALLLSYVLISLLILLFTFLFWRRINLKKKLWWVEVAPGYPLLGNAYDFADSTKSLNAMHQYLLKYDGLCYIELLWRPLLLVSDYKFVQWELSSTTLLTKSVDYQYLYNWLGGGILISDGEEWRMSRKILSPAFHFSILENFVEVFEEPTSVLVRILSKEVDKDSVNICPYITKFTLDVICQTSMGVQLNVQEGSHTDYFDAVTGMCKIVIERAFNPLKMIDILYHLSNDYTREKQYVKLLHQASNDVIDKRRKELENQKDNEGNQEVGTKSKMAFLDILLKYRDQDGKPLSRDFIRHEVDTFLFAGHDTTAAAISFALYCLANHPDVQQKALSEVKEVLGDRKNMTYRDLQEMKYLEMVIKETLRLYPSVPIYSRQTTQDVLYEEGKIIPKGVTLIVVAFTINRDPKVYEDPETFNPARFLNTEIKPYSYVPFSAGPRNCIGQKFAMLEMKSTLAKILLNLELLPAIPQHNLILASETILTSKNGIKIRLKKRS